MFGVRDDAILLKLHGDSGLGFEAWSLGFGVSDYYSILLKLHEGSGFWLRVAGFGLRFRAWVCSNWTRVYISTHEIILDTRFEFPAHDTNPIHAHDTKLNPPENKGFSSRLNPELNPKHMTQS